MKKIISIYFILFTAIVFSQRKYAADRYFTEFSYIKSAELYEKIYQKGDHSELVLTRLADSYYYNTDTKNAEIWYAKLFETYPQDSISPEYLFRYSQTLKSNGNYEKSDAWLLKFRESKKSDTRGKGVENTNYFLEYTKTKKRFTKIKNLSINTAYSDFGIFLFEKTLLFASTRPDNDSKKKPLYKWNEQPFLNLYQVEQGVDNNFKEVKKISNIINTRYHEASAIITKDGKYMYFTRSNYYDEDLRKDISGTTHLKLYRAELIKGQWDNVEELPFNSDAYSIGHPALSVDENELYFVSDMPGSYGFTDIYKVAILTDSTYSKPKNLGKKINTEGREMFPFINKDNVLYFSSDGHLGLGALDVFESQIEDSHYSEVKNIGTPINSKLDDFGFILNDSNTKGYFSSNRIGGKGDDDIYSFTVYECKETIEGFITEIKAKDPIVGAKVKLVNEKGEVVQKTETDAQGKYFFEQIDCEQKFVVVADKQDYISDSKKGKTQNINKSITNVDIKLTSLIKEDQIVINPIYFDLDKYQIREDAKYELKHIISVMEKHPEIIIRIESHTDSRGNNAYNELLSDKRAKATRDYIVSRGIDSTRIESAKGYGEYKLLNHCNDENSFQCNKKEHQLNRRSYFFIVKE